MLKISKTKGVAMFGLATLVAAAGFGPTAFAEGESLAEIFTNATFRECVVTAFKAEVDSTITDTSVLTDTQMASLTSLTCNEKNLTTANLTGLDKLTGLTALNLSDNQLATLDVSSNTALERLVLRNNVLTELDLSANANLIYLDIRGNADLDLEHLNITGTKLNTLTNDEGIWEEVAEEEPETGESTENNETPACSSWEIDDETISIFKGLLAAYGYDTSKYDATAVRMAAAQTNMCDGMSVVEARTLMNAMGVTDLSDAELTRIAEMVTNAYNAINDGATLDSLLAMMTKESGLLVPNTGVNTGEFNASVVIISLGVVIGGAAVFYAVRYSLKRKEAKVTFRR